MKDWLISFRRTIEPRRIESPYRKGLRMSLIEGIPAVILGNLLGGPLQTAYLLYLGFTSQQIGIVLAIPAFALLIQVFIAFAMQRWHNRRRSIMLLGIAHRTLWVATGLIPLLSPESAWVPLYMVLFLFSFLSAQAGGVIWTSLMADAVPPAVRGKYFGIRNMIHWAVLSVALLVGGQVMEWLPGHKGFTVLFVVSALCIVWNGWALSKYPNPPFQASQSGSSARMIARPFSDKVFLSATIFIALFVLAQNVAIPLFSYSMLDILHLNYTKVTLITMLQNIVMMLSYYYWGVLNGRYRAKTLLLWTFPLIAASCLVWSGIAVFPIMPVLVVAHILLGVGLGGYNLLIFNFLIGDSPKSERPMYVAVFSALTGIAGFLGPLAGGWLFGITAGGPTWVLQYGITAAAGVVLMTLSLGMAPFIFRTRK